MKLFFRKNILFFATVLITLTGCFMTLSSCIEPSAPKVIAHRGFWNTENSAQNSIAALMKADSIGAYGSELDVWLTSDGVPIVNHDPIINIEGKTFEIQDTPFEVISKAKLSNGESIPTLEEYLDAFMNCRNTRLIIECKVHKTNKQEYDLAKLVTKMVEERKLQDKVDYISFSLHCCMQFRNLDPKAKIYYLYGDLTPEELNELKIDGPDYNYNVIMKNPEWVERAHQLNQKVNVWTVNDPEHIQNMIDLKVDFITTDEPVLVQNMTKKVVSHEPKQ